MLRDNVHDQLLSAQGFTALVRVGSYHQCFLLLDRGRVDLVASAVDTLREKLQAAGVGEQRVRRTPVVLMKTEGFIALSRTTPATEVARWNEALTRLKASGRYQTLRERFMPGL